MNEIRLSSRPTLIRLDAPRAASPGWLREVLELIGTVIFSSLYALGILAVVTMIGMCIGILCILCAGCISGFE